MITFDQDWAEDAPVGLEEIAERLGVTRGTADKWRQRGVLPGPAWSVGGRPAWPWRVIRDWARETGRLARQSSEHDQGTQEEPEMTRTYQTREQYDAACERLAAHLSTLSADEVSLAYANGGTKDADGTLWVPAGENVLESAAENYWFVEEHGAAAQWSGGQWVGREPSDLELTDAALAIWGEDGDDFGYPA